MQIITITPNYETTPETLERLRGQIEGLLAEAGFDDNDLSVQISPPLPISASKTRLSRFLGR